jgi:hypothetical protein
LIRLYNRISLAVGIPGLILQIVGQAMTDSIGPLGKPVVVLGTGLLMFGLAYYAKAKGRHPAWCLMGFLSLLGLIVLACLEDRTALKGSREWIPPHRNVYGERPTTDMCNCPGCGQRVGVRFGKCPICNADLPDADQS